MATLTFDYLIVGSGVFRASTAYYLSKVHPKSSIALVDRSSSFPCSLAASYDFNKIVRADYANAFYCKLALEAREAWKNDPMYKSFYQQTGMVVLDDTGLGKQIVENYSNLDSSSEAVIVGTDDLKKSYDGLFEDANYTGVEEVFINPQSGWAEATLAVSAVMEAAVSNGVKCISGDVAKLVFNDSGDCTGVETKDGSIFSKRNYPIKRSRNSKASCR